MKQQHYSRLRNKHRGTLIIFWTIFQGLWSLLERVMHILFQNIFCLMVWGMPILRATLNVFAKCSRGYSRVQSMYGTLCRNHKVNQFQNDLITNSPFNFSVWKWKNIAISKCFITLRGLISRDFHIKLTAFNICSQLMFIFSGW